MLIYLIFEQVKEEVQDLQRKLTQVEGDLVTNKNQLEQANQLLEQKEKSLNNVSFQFKGDICLKRNI